MRALALVLSLGAAALLGACGDGEDKPADTGGGNGGGGGVALAGGGWDGGAGLDPTKSSDKVRVVAFFKPG